MQEMGEIGLAEATFGEKTPQPLHLQLNDPYRLCLLTPPVSPSLSWIAIPRKARRG